MVFDHIKLIYSSVWFSFTIQKILLLEHTFSNFFLYRRVFTLSNKNQSMDFLDNIILLGMAFYVLRATHLLFECYSGRQKPVKWSELIAWLWFLPTLQVGS